MAHEERLYQHTKRPEWGVSAIVSAQDDRTTFLFDDGTRRTITIGHMHLMQPVELESGDEDEIRRKLAKFESRKAGSATKRKRVTKKKPAPAAGTPS